MMRGHPYNLIWFEVSSITILVRHADEGIVFFGIFWTNLTKKLPPPGVLALTPCDRRRNGVLWFFLLGMVLVLFIVLFGFSLEPTVYYI